MKTLSDQVSLTHSHDDSERPMRHLEDARIDGLRVRQFGCDCGFAAAVISRVDDEEPGGNWPFRFPSSSPLA